jgi:ketosteroid isomerase-like protein
MDTQQITKPPPDIGAVKLVRRFYAAVAERDLDAAGACFAEDAVWVLPGDSAIAGAHRGWAAIRDEFLAKLGPLSGGTFRARLMDVCVGDQYVVAVQHATADHEGRRLDVTGCQLMRIEDGRIVEVRGHYSDQRSLDEFWP